MISLKQGVIVLLVGLAFAAPSLTTLSSEPAMAIGGAAFGLVFGVVFAGFGALLYNWFSSNDDAVDEPTAKA